MQENIQYVPNPITPCTQGAYRIAKLLTEYEPVHPSRRSPSVQFQDCLDQVPRPIKSTRSIRCLSFHPPKRQSRHGSSAHPVRPRVSTNLGMLCKYRRRRTSSVVLQCGFNQAVFLVVIMATARPDLSLVPVKRGGGSHTRTSTEPGSRCVCLIFPYYHPTAFLEMLHRTQYSVWCRLW